jgi:hypothetical protein
MERTPTAIMTFGRLGLSAATIDGEQMRRGKEHVHRRIRRSTRGK